jgi:hypothetical protein
MININELSQNQRIKIAVIIISIPILWSFLFSPYRMNLRGSKKAALEHVKSNCKSECKKHKITATKVLDVSEAEKLNGIESKICAAVRYAYRISSNSDWMDKPVGLLVIKKDGEYSFNPNTFQCDPNIIESGM